MGKKIHCFYIEYDAMVETSKIGSSWHESRLFQNAQINVREECKIDVSMCVVVNTIISSTHFDNIHYPFCVRAYGNIRSKLQTNN